MKTTRKLISVITLAAMLITILAGCTAPAVSEPTQEPVQEPVQEPTQEPTQEPMATEPEIPEATPTDEAQSEPSVEPAEPTAEPQALQSESAKDEPMIEAMRSVLLGNSDFYSTDAVKKLNINSMSELVSTDESINVTAKQLAALDLDGDRTDEILLSLSVNGDDYYGFLILHYNGSEVYGYTAGYRAFNDIKEDGTFSYSSSASDSGFGRMSFGDSIYETQSITYSESSSDSENNFTINYYVDGQQATEEQFNEAMENQRYKDSPEWVDFTADAVNSWAENELNTVISADYATDELLAQFSSFDEYDGVKDEYSTRVIITSDETLRDVKFTQLGYEDDEYEKIIIGDTLYSQAVLSPDRPLAIWVTFPEIFPLNGVTYTDAKGVTRNAYFSMSMKDGSIMLIEF